VSTSQRCYEFLAAAIAEDAHVCHACGPDGRCPRAALPFGQVTAPSNWEQVITALVTIYNLPDDCGASASILGLFVAKVSAHTNARISSCDASLQLNGDMTRVTHVSITDKKRGRYDEDFKTAVTLSLKEEKRVHNGGQALRVLGGATVANAQWWRDSALLEHQAAGLLSMAMHRNVHIIEDGGRIGNPSEENVFYFCWGEELCRQRCSGYQQPRFA